LLTFDASHYTINNWQTAEAGLGCATFRPQGRATMHIRPLVRWNGYDTLRHRAFQPGTTEQRLAICVAEIGIMVQQRAASALTSPRSGHTGNPRCGGTPQTTRRG
jgi:hypothetical protein